MTPTNITSVYSPLRSRDHRNLPVQVCSVYARPAIIAIKRSKTVPWPPRTLQFSWCTAVIRRFTNEQAARAARVLPPSRLVSRATTRFSRCLLIPRCGNDLWDRAGSGMAEKWYFRDDTLNHGTEKHPFQTFPRIESVSLRFLWIFFPPFFLSFLSSSRDSTLDDKKFERILSIWNEFFSSMTK